MTITSAPQRGLKLEWPAVAGALSYRIDRDLDANDGVDLFFNIGNVPSPATSHNFTDLRLADALSYKYRVRALSASGLVLATTTTSVSGDLAASIDIQHPTSPLDDSSDNMSRAMATATREGVSLRHVLAVGQPGAEQAQGLVKIYERDFHGGAWTEVQTLRKPSSPNLQDHFGASVSLSPNGQYLAVGIPGDDRPTQGMGINPQLNAGMEDVDDSGAVQVYRYVGSAWVPHGWFKAINAGRGDAFGTAVAISDEGHLIVGAPNEDSPASAGLFLPTSADAPELRDDPSGNDRGAIYNYVNGASAYSFGGFVKPPTTGGGTSLHFGAAIAIDPLAQRAAVGAPRASYNGASAGGVVVYDIAWTLPPPPLLQSVVAIWALRSTFGPGGDRIPSSNTDNPIPPSDAYRGLGGSLSMSQDGNWLAAGYADKSGLVAQTGATLPSRAGQVTLYRRNPNGTWAAHSWLTAPVPVSGDRFGISVSLVNSDNGLQVLAGALEDSSGQKGLTRAADIVPESFVAVRGSGAAYAFAGRADLSQPPVLKARLKSPEPLIDQFLGQATAITLDGNELLLTGEFKGNTGRPTGQAIFFGY
ncbi:MAG: hypothetical protein GTN84_11545 [Hydrogenophaga sp.]|uniref:hypothetical protein n=1 Tax=Hydrogenophaga sp. TaxID=1904254 RepID=UPI0016BAFEA2|nr:hypothetical protein [Hydrogenophaga sp.]NIM41719.1 hypothetical protein [Hydrogenophaga sp.]NIN27024.1 hypothetical protein [Hydrogenophaga sp.]NIN31725.1 hypothetical protein [Hydrogenophaga sp.]NIN55969.1 hypothetical protein [Hydrogenophaga sp.]NIO52096.1 hypothetical protein [Hydrogenophaga sp.]